MSEQTPNLGLYKPAEGNTNWAAEINANWDTLDSAVGGALLTDHVSGLKLEYASASQVKIKEGKCRSDDDAEDMAVSSDITVDITTSGANGLDTGSEAASTWYYVWLIKNTTSGTVAGLLSASATAPTLPGGYTKKRRIGSVRNDSSSDFLKFIQTGLGRQRYVRYDDTNSNRALLSGTATSWTDVDCSSYVPTTSVIAQFLLEGVRGPSGTGYAMIRPNGSSATFSVRLRVSVNESVFADCATDSAQKIEYQALSATSLTIYIAGYWEEL